MTERLVNSWCLNLALLWLAGCTGIIHTPEGVLEPRKVHLLEHGRHTSLLLTAADQRRFRYAYGDWAWYVDNQQGPASGARALFIRSQAALGRQEIPAVQPGESLSAVLGLGIDRVLEFHVEAARVDALLARLENAFSQSSAHAYYSERRKLSFIPDPTPYTFSHNSNHRVAQWLEQLGIKVKGNPATGRWQLASPAS